MCHKILVICCNQKVLNIYAIFYLLLITFFNSIFYIFFDFIINYENLMTN